MNLSCLIDVLTEDEAIDGFSVQTPLTKNPFKGEEPNIGKHRIKTGLAIEIKLAMKTLGLTQQAAAKRMGIPQPKVSGMMRGDFTNLSESKLMDCLNRLGYDIEIKVRPATELIGHLTLAKT